MRSLKANDIMLSDNKDAVIANGIAMSQVYSNGILVWEKFISPPGDKITVTESSTITAGVDFPAETALTLCMAGGGGAGDYGSSLYERIFGGLAGGIISQSITPMAYGAEVHITIGVGGINGYDGASSSFDSIIAIGGIGGRTSGYRGDGGSRTTCGGTYYNGSSENTSGYADDKYGGQAGAFGNGGNGEKSNPGYAGGISAGGGAGKNAGGPGGRGQVVLSW